MAAAAVFEWAADPPDSTGARKGYLVLPDGTVHYGGFEGGRASGPGVMYNFTGSVMSGSWVANKKVGPFVTIDPKGGEWADVYDESGKRISRKKQAPPPPNSPGALRCRHCGVKFHAQHNSRCRQHAGKWMQASEASEDGAEIAAAGTAEFPDGGIWLCCGSRQRVGGETCKLGLHANDDAGGGCAGGGGGGGGGGDVLKLSRTAGGEVVMLPSASSSGPGPGGGSGGGSGGGGAAAGGRDAGGGGSVLTPPCDVSSLPRDWRQLARECVLA